MKKSKLISLLNALEGDPDIVLWNGMVGDWMDISPELLDGVLVKQTFEYFCRMVEFERKRDAKDWDVTLKPEEIASLKRDFNKNYDWGTPEFVTSEDIKQKRYQKKNIVYLNAKSRGVKTWDRLGDISY